MNTVEADGGRATGRTCDGDNGEFRVRQPGNNVRMNGSKTRGDIRNDGIVQLGDDQLGGMLDEKKSRNCNLSRPLFYPDSASKHLCRQRVGAERHLSDRCRCTLKEARG